MPKSCQILLTIAVFILSLQSVVLSSTINLPETGQTTSYYTGEDGDIQAGVAWPSPRFTNNGDGTMTDNLTGLVWTQDANLPASTKTWQEALDYVAGMNASTYSNFGYTDWRLPNFNEHEGLINIEHECLIGYSNRESWLNGQGFTNVQSSHYWSSTSYAIDTGYAWYVNMINGNVGSSSKTSSYYVWPVRSGSGGSFDNSDIWKTGQTTSYATGDDGDIQAGVAWPSPRFTDNGDGTIADDLTGLVWLKDASCFEGGIRQKALNIVAVFNSTPSYYNCAEYTGNHTDWRLPNRKELLSLIDRSQIEPALPSEHPFANVQTNGHYWSGSTDLNGTWKIGIKIGNVVSSNTGITNTIWPVRAGVGYLLFAPTGFSASASNCITGIGGQICTVTLNWNAVSAASGYKLYYGFSSGNYAGSADLVNVTSQSFSGIANGTYYLAITAYNSSGTEGSKSSEIILTVGSSSSGLSTPTGFSGSVNDTTVSFSWDAVSGASGYKMYFGTSSGDYDYENPVDLGNVTSQVFPNLPKSTYYLALTAYNSMNEESYLSDEVSLTTSGETASYELISLLDGSTLAFNASGSIENTLSGDGVFTVSGSVPTVLFPTGTLLGVTVYVKGLDRTRPFSTDTFRVSVESGNYSAVSTSSNEPYAPMTYQLQISYSASQNRIGIVRYVEEAFAQHLGMENLSDTVIAVKDFVIGTRREHMIFKQKNLQRLQVFLYNILPIYNRLNAATENPLSQNPSWEETKEELSCQLVKYERVYDAWKSTFVVWPEISLVGSVGSLTSSGIWVVIERYSDGNHDGARSTLSRINNSINSVQDEIERRLSTINRIINEMNP